MKTVRLIDGLRRIEREIAREKGPFTLFAALRFEGRQHWNILASAPWMDAGRLDAMGYIAERLQALPIESLLDVSGVDVLPTGDPRVVRLLRGDMAPSDVLGDSVAQAYVLTPGAPRARRGRSRRAARRS